MKIQYLGHACLLIHIGETSLLVDPFISGNPKASHLKLSEIMADYILVTHAHQDHVLDVEKLAKQNQAVLISNYEIVSYYEKKGLKGHPMNHGGSWTFDFGTLTYTQAIHSSSFADGTYGGQAGGFIINSSEGCLYIAGDTALMMDMKLFPMRQKIDLAVLPIGDNFTMGITDALLASDFLECPRILGYHYDTFGFIEIDHEAAIESFKQNHKELYLLKIGASMNLNEN